MINKYLTKDLIDVKDRVESVDQAIEYCGKQLIDNGLITEKYTQSMKDTYKEFGPYMVLVDKVALFHGKPGLGVNKTGLCLVKLNEPYAIKDHKKQIQLCFAFSSLDKHEHMDMIQSFAQLLMDQSKVDALCKASSVEEIVKIIEEEEK